jgi:molecular chaperone DnaJ
MSKKDYYQVLGISKSATPAEMKKAYHKLAMQYHPDRNSEDKDAEKKFKEINEAYDILKDEQKRAAYDRFGHNAFQQGGNGGGFNQKSGGGFHPDVNDIFGDFFSDFMGGSAKRQRQSSQIRGSDLKYNLSISLEEAFKGVDKDISFNTEVKCTVCNGSGSEDGKTTTICDMCGGMGATRIQQGFFTLEQTCNKCSGSGQVIKNPCKKCHGNGRYSQQKNLRVNVPAGVEDGIRIRLIGEGEAGIREGSSGDLYIFITIKSHPIYRVEGVDLHCRLPVSVSKAALGGEIVVPNIEGEKVKLKIPPGTQNGEQIKVKNNGMSKVRSSSRGDMIVHIFVETPKNLSKKQRELLEEFAKESGEDKLDEANFFNKMKNLWS